MLLQKKARLLAAAALVFRHFQNHAVERVRLKLHFFNHRHQIGVSRLKRCRHGYRQLGSRKARHAGRSVARLQQILPAGFIVRREFKRHEAVFRHQAGGLPIIKQQRLSLLISRSDGRIQRRAGARVHIVERGVQAGVGEQAGVEGFAGPAAGAIEKTRFIGRFGVGKQAGKARQISHTFQIGMRGLHIIGHIPALLCAAFERVADHRRAPLGHGLLHNRRAPHPLLGDNLNIVLCQRRFQRRRGARHRFGGAAVALVQQGVEHGGGELAAFPIERAQLHGFIGRTGGKRGRGKQQANQQQQQAAHEKPFRRHGADKRSVTQNAV